MRHPGSPKEGIGTLSDHAMHRFEFGPKLRGRRGLRTTEHGTSRPGISVNSPILAGRCRTLANNTLRLGCCHEAHFQASAEIGATAKTTASGARVSAEPAMNVFLNCPCGRTQWTNPWHFLQPRTEISPVDALGPSSATSGRASSPQRTMCQSDRSERACRMHAFPENATYSNSGNFPYQFKHTVM